MGPVAPFDAASIFLAIGMAIIISSWTKNYGDSSESKDLMTQFRGAAVAIASGLSLPPLSLSYIYRRSMKNPKWQSCNYAYISFCLLNLDLIVSFFLCKNRWKDSIIGCNTIFIRGFNVHFCVSMDTCFKPKWWRHSTWFHFCYFHVIFHVRKLFSFSFISTCINQSWKLHANCLHHLFSLSLASSHHKCTPNFLTSFLRVHVING